MQEIKNMGGGEGVVNCEKKGREVKSEQNFLFASTSPFLSVSSSQKVQYVFGGHTYCKIPW